MTLTTALMYLRVSTEDQAREGMSLETQLAECQRYAVRHEWVLGATYTDILSGKIDNRPQYQQLLADVRQLRAHGAQLAVVVAALDRFGRHLLERVRSREELKSLGVPVHSVREGGEVSDLTANILGAVAQEESRRLGERIRAAHRYVLENGWRPQGHAPWGYRWRPATEVERMAGAPRSVLDLDDEVAPAVREAFGLALTTSMRQIARWAQTLPPSALQGKHLSVATIAKVLTNPTYVSRDPTVTGDVLATRVMRWPALIDDQLWLSVQQELAAHSVMHRQASGRYLLTGLLRCPRCGGRTTGKPTSDGYRHYRCSVEHSTARGSCSWQGPAWSLEEGTLAEVRGLLEQLRGAGPSAIRTRWRDLQRPGELDGYRERRLQALERKVKQLVDRLTDAAVMLVEKRLDEGGYALVRDSTQAELRAADEEIARLSGAVPQAKLPELGEVLLQVGGWSTILQDASMEAQRTVLRELVQHVDGTKVGIGRYRVQVTWTDLGEALLLGSRALTASRVV